MGIFTLAQDNFMHLQIRDKSQLVQMKVKLFRCQRFAFRWKTLTSNVRWTRNKMSPGTVDDDSVRFASNCFHFINQIKRHYQRGKSGKVKSVSIACWMNGAPKNPLEVDRRFAIYFRRTLKLNKKRLGKSTFTFVCRLRRQIRNK